jgi:hypothetical protein
VGVDGDGRGRGRRLIQPVRRAAAFERASWGAREKTARGGRHSIPQMRRIDWRSPPVDLMRRENGGDEQRNRGSGHIRNNRRKK